MTELLTKEELSLWQAYVLALCHGGHAYASSSGALAGKADELLAAYKERGGVPVEMPLAPPPLDPATLDRIQDILENFTTRNLAKKPPLDIPDPRDD
jgi:hypothetical protein